MPHGETDSTVGLSERDTGFTRLSMDDVFYWAEEAS